MKIVAVLDYGCGNIASIINMLDYIGVKSCIIDDPLKIQSYHSIILPGVGNFKYGMEKIEASGFRDVLDIMALNNHHILGICLGMQLMTRSSEEGGKGLGWFNCETRKFPSIDSENKKILVPHMGWDYISEVNGERFFGNEDKFYFVHSYYVDAEGTAEELSSSNYGGLHFSSAIKKGNLLGVQFHPEKSHVYGLEFFKKYFTKIGVLNVT
jgi:imidazole glycerol-phosphate synthase subunit HisH